ncbi:hypothetical protein ABBQ32_004689 [Trebouxia sp. C0010 RCD-2024]
MCSVCYDVQAVAPALCDWMIVVEAAGPDWAPAGPKFGQFFLLPAMFRRDYDGLLHTLICTAAIYLDSQEKWKELQATQLGLHDLVRHLGVCMHSTAKALLKKDEEDMTSAMAEVESYFEILSTASKHQAVTVTISDAMPASASGPHATDRDMLILLWRRVACAAVMLLCLFCHGACHLQRQYKDSTQDKASRHQKRHSHVKGTGQLDRLSPASAKFLVKLRSVRLQLEQLALASHIMVREPAWPSVLDYQQPEDWPGSMAPANHHQDLMYLSSEKAMSNRGAQAIHSLYLFMLGEGSAAAAAEQLVAEEAQEAAKAAAKKAKKQKAKARKQQARSDAISPSEAGAALSPQTPEPTATLHHQAGSLESSANGSTPDRDSPDQQLQLQHRTAQGSTAHASSVATALIEQGSSSAAATDGLCNGAAAVDASRGADAIFLDQLFCCPITKVAMVDPVIAGDGHTYERTAIQHWLQGSSLSPVTGDKLPHTRLVPNVLAKSAFAQHAQVS